MWCSCLVAGLAAVASACSFSSDPTKVGRNFSVHVAHNSKAIVGIQIEVRTDPNGNEESRSLQTVATDDSGLSKFTNLKPGRYYVRIRHVAFPQSVEIVVDSRPTTGKTEKITFEWPSVKPISVRFVSGLLNAELRTGNPLSDQAHSTFGALEARLTLSSAVSGDIIETQMATASGAFGFRPVPTGLYLLKVEVGENLSHRYQDVDGHIPIEVDPDAKDPSLNIFLFPAVCGELGFENKEGPVTE